MAYYQDGDAVSEHFLKTRTLFRTMIVMKYNPFRSPEKRTAWKGSPPISSHPFDPQVLTVVITLQEKLVLS